MGAKQSPVNKSERKRGGRTSGSRNLWWISERF
jgi:hypothetical protein